MVPYDAGDHFEQIFLLYVDAGGRSLLIGDCLENCWLATSNSCITFYNVRLSKYDISLCCYWVHFNVDKFKTPVFVAKSNSK